jgi:Family of unknown function (DUF6084)
LATQARTGAPPGTGSPPDLAFAVEGVEVDRYAVVPTLRFKLTVSRLGGGDVRSVALNTQIRISAARRSYGEPEQERLVELFGAPGQWSRSLRSFSWANAALQVPAFTDQITVDLPMVCTYDFEVTTAQYFHALDDGEVPLELLFSGTLFYSEGDGGLRVSHIPWEKEAEYRLPVAVWREMMNRYFGDSAWLRLRRDTFDRVHAYKTRGGHLTWEDAVEALMNQSERGAES